MLWQKLDGSPPTDDSKYSYEELKGYVRGALAAALKANYFEQLNADEFRYGDDSITSVYKVNVQLDSDSGLKYIEIPATTIAVPNSNRNVNISSANPVNRFSVDFIPTRKEEVFLGKFQKSIPCVVLFYREADRFYFYNEDFKDSAVKVVQKYSLPTDDETDIGIPEEYVPQIIQTAEVLLQTQRPSDRVNDGVPIS